MTDYPCWTREWANQVHNFLTLLVNSIPHIRTFVINLESISKKLHVSQVIIESFETSFLK